MKKIIALSMVLVLALCAFAGCGAKMTDGEYRAEFSEGDDHGWKDYVVVTVADGKIASVEFDSANEEGQKKTESDWYKEAMEPVAGTYPGKFFPELEEQYMEKQDSSKMDAIAGATMSSDSVKVLLAEAEKQIKEGKPGTYVVAK